MNIKKSNPLPPARISQLLSLPPWFIYLFSITITLFTLWVRTQIVVDYEKRTLMLLFMLPIIISAYLGGLWAGLLSTLVTAVCVFYFITPPARSFEIAQPYDLIQFLVLLISGILVSLLTESLHRSRRRIEEASREHIQMEQALYRKEEDYRDLVENSHVLICTHDLAGNFLSVNQAAVELTGYSRETLLKSNIKQFLVSNAEEKFFAYIKEITKHGRAKGTMQVRLANGEIRTWAYENSLRSEGLAEPIVRGFAHDITERIRAEQAQQASELRFRALIEHGLDNISLLAADGTLLWENPSTVSMLGYEHNRFKNRNIFELLHPDDMERVQKQFAEILNKEGNVVYGSFRLKHTNGSWLWVEGIGTNLLHEPSVGAVVINYRDVTERKRAEELIHKNEQQMQSLVLSLDDIVFEFDEQGTYLNVWTADEKLLFKPKAQILGQRIVEVLGEEKGRPFSDAVKRVLVSGHPESIEYPLDVMGGKRWFVARISPIHANRTASMLVRDITERKKAETDLLASEQKFATAFRASPDALIISRLSDGMLLELNENWEELTGLSREESIGKTSTALGIFTTPQQREELIAQLMANGSIHDFEMNIRHKSGEQRQVSLSAQPIKIQQQECLLTILRDITERKKVEQALHESHDKLTKLTAQVPGVVYQYLLYADGRSCFPFVSQGMNDIYEVCPDDVYEDATPVFGRLHPDDFDRVSNLIQESARTLQPFHCEFRVVLPRQGLRWRLSDALPERTEDGNTLWYGIISDITERKHAEEFIRQYANELEVRVQERTAELIHANRAKDEFLANMSHELRTPLNGILGFSEVLMEGIRGPLNERQQQAVELIQSSGQHLLSLINDILDVSKIESGRFELLKEDTLVNDICRSSLNLIKQIANKKFITVDYSPFLKPTMIHADGRRIKQVLVNLLNNAVKFTPEHGNIKLEIQPDAANSLMRFSVTDTGIGIAPEYQQKLFKPFVQVDNSLSRQYEGTGLGLSLVKKLVEMHGGSVYLQSEPNKGSCFTFTLPWNQTSQNNSESETQNIKSNSPQLAEETSSSTNNKILLAEDNEANCLFIKDYLEKFGYAVFVARNGAEALAKAHDISPDIILMDVQMPDINGFDVTHHLRSDPQFATVPIIALTALAMPGDRERCLNAGMNEYLSKPVKLRELQQMIENFLDRPDNA